MTDLRTEAKQLHGKLSLITQEIQTKESEIQNLRTANVKLLELHFDKSRKPKSLEQQRKSITRIDLEILELQLVQKSLNEKLMQTDAAIREEQLKSRLAQFHETSKSQLQDIETVRRNITALEKSLVQLEKVSGNNGALYNLLRILWDNSEAKEFIDLREVLENWSVSNINLTLPTGIEICLVQFNNQIFGLHNQLNSICSGSKYIPKIPKAKSPLLGNKPLTQNEFRLQQEGRDAIERAKKAKRIDRDFVNPNKTIHIPDKNPYAVNQ